MQNQAFLAAKSQKNSCCHTAVLTSSVILVAHLNKSSHIASGFRLPYPSTLYFKSSLRRHSLKFLCNFSSSQDEPKGLAYPHPVYKAQEISQSSLACTVFNSCRHFCFKTRSSWMEIWTSRESSMQTRHLLT